MVDGYPEQIQNQEDSITELTAVSEDLQEQREAIENVVLATAEADSDTYLSAKMVEIGGSSVIKGGDYGSTNVTDWQIVSAGMVPNPTPPPLMIPGFIVLLQGSDLDGTGSQEDIDQFQRQNDFTASYNHIWQDLGTDGTYGIKPTRDSVETGKSIVQKNKDKIEQVQEIYTRYLP